MTNLWLTCFTHRAQQNSIRYLRISIENTIGISCIVASHRIAAPFEVPNVVQAHRYDESIGTMSTIASLDTVKSCLDHRTGSLKRRGKRRGSWKLRIIGEKPPMFLWFDKGQKRLWWRGRDGDRMGFVQKKWNCLLNSTKYHTNLWNVDQLIVVWSWGKHEGAREATNSHMGVSHWSHRNGWEWYTAAWSTRFKFIEPLYCQLCNIIN